MEVFANPVLQWIMRYVSSVVILADLRDMVSPAFAPSFLRAIIQASVSNVQVLGFSGTGVAVEVSVSKISCISPEDRVAVFFGSFFVAVFGVATD